MNWQVILMALFDAGIEIANRHLTAAGQPPLTDAQVAAEKEAAFAGAYGDINAWFVSKGLTPPA